MGSSDKEGMEERTSPEERVNSSGGERQGAERHVVGELSNEEKQQLFIKKLYRLSKTHIDETPEENLALARDKIRATVVASPILSLPTATTAPPVQVEEQPQQQDQRDSPVTPTPSPPEQPQTQSRLLESFASQLSVLTSCVGVDYLCTGSSAESSTKSTYSSSRKKKSPLLRQLKPDIPSTIVLEPTHISRLEDDDSLARHMSALAKRQTSTHQPYSIVEEGNVDDASKNSPQCVAELSYEMEISRIIPAAKQHHGGKKKRRFSRGFGKHHKSSSSLIEEAEMEF
jgi:hypothetical protein